LGVVDKKDGCVDIVGRGHNVAVIIGLDHVRMGAVLARSTQAQGFARSEVATIRIDFGVYDRKLIGGHIVGGRY
jgi:hypothetical protein